MMRCPEPHELVGLSEGELIESRARALRGHVDACAACRSALEGSARLSADLRKPIPGVLGSSAESFADDVVARLALPRNERAATSKPRLRWAWLALAAAIPLAIGVSYRSSPSRDAEWTARGAAQAEDDVRRTAIRFGRIVDGAFQPIRDGDVIRAGDALAGEVAGTDGAPRYLLAFVVDAAGERHWIYPAYEVGMAPPHALALPRATSPRVLGSMVRLDDVAPGPGRVVAIVLRRQESVDYIERASLDALTADGLAARYRDALVVVRPVVVENIR